MIPRCRSGMAMMVFGAALVWAAGQGMAQDAAGPAPMGISSPAVTGAAPVEGTDGAAATTTAAAPVAGKDGGVSPNDIPSLLFTFWEHTAIVDAKRYRGLVRPPDDEELTRALQGRTKDGPPPTPEERDIRLGGIVFVNSSDWTIWLNGKRVTPKAVPHQAMDLKVYDEYIEMKWFDDYTNQIFPIRLRPHQRFNIDTRIFLPG